MTYLLMAVAALWAATAAQTHLLAVHRGRMAVRRTALRARATLLAGAATGLAAALLAGLLVASPVAMPLLVLPAVAALWRTLPRLGALAGALRTDPWGPSDPATRHAAADPALTVPPLAALAGALAAPVAQGGLAAALVAYGLVAAAVAAYAGWAPRRREAAVRAGVLPRTVVRAADPPAVADREAA